KEYEGRFDDWIRQYGGEIDVVLLSRPHIAMEYLEAMHKHSCARVWYYGHDIHYLRLDEHLKLQPDDALLRSDRDKAQRQEQHLWEHVDAVYYPSDDETKVVRAWLVSRTRRMPMPRNGWCAKCFHEYEPRIRTSSSRWWGPIHPTA